MKRQAVANYPQVNVRLTAPAPHLVSTILLLPMRWTFLTNSHGELLVAELEEPGAYPPSTHGDV
jgi:hypothetical protein